MSGLDITALAIQLAVLLLSLSVHESAHAWTADRLGDRLARSQGRVTLNPLAHIDWFGTLLLPLLLYATGSPVFGWAKPVPVNSASLKRPRQDHAIIAAAGPFSNLLLAALCLIGLQILKGAGLTTDLRILTTFLYFGMLLNIILAVFNLFPIPPLDGGWILSGLIPPVSRFYDLIRPYSLLLLFGLFYTGVFSAVIRPILAFVRAFAL